jgi:hypothetical protein
MQRLLAEDRGLGTAYERYCFYQLLDDWAASFGVETFLEGPVDGMAGVSGVHGVGLARRGVRVTTALPTQEHADVARGIYERCGAHPEVIVASEHDVESLPKADMVLCYHAFGLVDDWRAYLKRVATRAKKVLIVAVCNPHNWGVALVRGLMKLRGSSNADSPESWYTENLAPELWALGRVREHTYFDCPWWPDIPVLQVAPGLPLSARVKQWMGRPAPPTPEIAKPSKFVYGAEQWPYFGGPGWTGELLPALLKHPCFEGANPKLRERAAHLHAFIVDMRPRTPQERRRLGTVS